MSNANQSDPENYHLEVVKLVHDTHRNEINLHRDAITSINQWATNVYLAIAAGILALSSRPESLTDSTKIFIIIVSWAIAFFVIAQIYHSNDAINVNARIVVKSNIFLKLFENGIYFTDESMYPASWTEWGKSKGAGYYAGFNMLLPIITSISISYLALKI